jgi:hypothetical protein
MTSSKSLDHQIASRTSDEPDRELRPEPAELIAAEASWELSYSPRVTRGNTLWQRPMNTAPRAQLMLSLQQHIGNRAVQCAINRSRSTEPGDDLARRIQAASSGGSALDAAARDRLEPGLGADLSSVRIHADAEADHLSRSVEAIAFTSGQDIFFRSGTYDPNSSQGLHLLAHETTHVVQQSAGPVAGTPAPGGVSISDPSDSFEQAAEQTAARVMSERLAPSQHVVDSTPSGLAQRLAARANKGAEETQPVQFIQASAACLPIQRDKTGWTDASKGSAQTSQPDVKAPKDTSWNVGETSIGSIKRIPIEGLTHGNQSKSENLSRRGSTPESAIGKAIVLVPNDFDPKKPTTVLLHLHGFGAGYRQLDDPEELKKQLKTLTDEKTTLEKERDAALQGADKAKVRELKANLMRKDTEIKKAESQVRQKLDYAGVLQPGQVRDVELYRLEQQLDALHQEQQQQQKAGKKSGPQIIAVLAQGTSSSGFGDIDEKPTEYLDGVFGKLGLKPKDFHVVLSGHSGGGVPTMSTAATLAKKGKPGDKLPQVDEIILFDAINGSNEVTTVKDWLNGHIAADKTALKKMSTKADVDSYFSTRPRFRGYFSWGYKALYEDVKEITDELSKKESDKKDLSLLEYEQNKLADQYRVFGPIGDKPTDGDDFRPHEKLMGAKRTEEAGKPAPSKVGILHEALSALPVQPVRIAAPTSPVQRYTDEEEEESVQPATLVAGTPASIQRDKLPKEEEEEISRWRKFMAGKSFPKATARVGSDTATFVEALIETSEFLKTYLPSGKRAQTSVAKNFTIFDFRSQFEDKLASFSREVKPISGAHPSGPITEGFYHRRSDSIYLPPEAQFGHAIHEGIHKYSSVAVERALGVFLNEGITQHFADLVQTEQKVQGSTSHAYQDQLDCANIVLSWVNDDILARAYFRGDANPLAQEVMRRLHIDGAKLYSLAHDDDGKGLCKRINP